MNVNIWTIVVVVFTAGGFYVSTNGMREDIAELRSRTADVPMLAHRITAAETQIAASNDRMDRAFSSFSERLDRSAEATANGFAAVTGSLASIDTRVAVLTQRIESITPDQRSELRPAPLR